MMSENKFPQSAQDPKLVPSQEQMTPEGKLAKKSEIVYETEGSGEEPSFGDKAREFEKESDLLKISAEQIARLFVDAINNDAESIVVGNDVKELFEKTKSALNNWLMGHAYRQLDMKDISGYLGVKIGMEVDNVLKAEGGEGWKIKSENIKNRKYWSQFKEQMGL